MTEIDPKTNKPTLTVIRGAKLSLKAFAALTFSQKMDRLRGMSSAMRQEFIIQDPEGKELTKAFSPQEFYLMIKEIGETDAAPLLTSASADQLAICLDLDAWDKWNFKPDQACQWLERMMVGSDDEQLSRFHSLDPELLQLLLLKELDVGVGYGELATDADRLGSWDHTFDNHFFITFRHSEHARLLGAFLDLLFRLDQQFFYSLMENCCSAVATEVEELCYNFRTGRLTDLGFPSYEQAIEIYTPLAPGSYVRTENKLSVSFSETNSLIPQPIQGTEETLLAKILPAVMTEDIGQELGYLLNCALIFEQGTTQDESSMRTVTERVYGWLNIALEYLSGGDEIIAADFLSREYLQRLFRLGCGIIQEVARQARSIRSDDYATAKAIRGLTAQRPLYYRLLDPDHIDGYREFHTMQDIKLVRGFLTDLQGSSQVT